MMYRRWWRNEAPIHENGQSKIDYLLKKYPPTKHPVSLPCNIPFNKGFIPQQQKQRALTQEEMVQQFEGGGCGRELYNRSSFF